MITATAAIAEKQKAPVCNQSQIFEGIENSKT